MSREYKFHPLANVFPLMEGAEFEAFVADIKKTDGPREPITIFEDKILDGRNRYNACKQLGIEPTFTPYLEDDPAGLRHLDEHRAPAS